MVRGKEDKVLCVYSFIIEFLKNTESKDDNKVINQYYITFAMHQLPQFWETLNVRVVKRHFPLLRVNVIEGDQ